MQKPDKFFIIRNFLIWKTATIMIAVLSIKYIPLSGINFFGGKHINYITNPLFWGWANFDGEHYLSIAMFGYKDLQLAFFPAYSIMMRLGATLFGSNLVTNLWSGMIISNVLFLLSLFLLWRVIILDYSEKIARIAIILMLVFPTSFFFGAVYTESLFLFSSLLTYYLYRKNKYFLAGLMGIVMTLTRLYGALLLAAIFVDIIINKMTFARIIKEKIYLMGVSILGLIGYMWYCGVSKGDFLAFYTLQTNVGEQRSDHLIILPQVFYRYFVKIIPNLTWSYLPVVYTTLLETVIATMFLLVIIISFKKLRWDYWIYMALGYLVPTLTGSFSSLPRYVVVLFPAFIFGAIKIQNTNKYLKLGIFISMVIIGIVAEMMFFRGYFVS